MALDIGSYFSVASLTPTGLLQYWPDEIQLFGTSANPTMIDLEFGESKSAPERSHGDLILTTHRIIWMQQHQQSSSTTTSSPKQTLYLPLESIDRIELKSGSLLSFGFATPRVVLHLHDPLMMAYLKQQYQSQPSHMASHTHHALTPTAATSSASSTLLQPPAKSTIPRFARLVFRGEPPHVFMQHLQSALNSGVWKQSRQTSSTAPTGPPALESQHSFKTTGAGISGIVRDVKQRERNLDRTLEQAFTDLDALMSNAKTIVDLAAKLSATGSRELSSAAAQNDFDQMLTSMGIVNPVTQSMSGSSYHVQLAKEMADFLPPFLQKNGGMLLLTDVYVLINRARGTQLISPQDCLLAATSLKQLSTTPLRLHEFSSGVKVILADVGTVEEVSERIRAELEAEAKQRANRMTDSSTPFHPYKDAPSISPLELSDRWHISIILAKQYLQIAEQKQILCRDESIHGLTFYINMF